MNLQFFVPFQKFDEKTRRVYGVASVEEPDRANEIMDYDTSKPYVVAWSQRLAKASGGKNLGNVRAMHGDVAAGHVVELECDDLTKSFPVCVEITDDNEWAKCLKGTYTGFSFGGKYVKKWQDPVLAKCKRYTANPSELSLADVPCVTGATITMVKLDGTEEQIEARGQVQQVWTCGAHEHFEKVDAEECFEKANDNHDEKGRFSSGDAHRDAAIAHERAAVAHDNAHDSGSSVHEREAMNLTDKALERSDATGTLIGKNAAYAGITADRGEHQAAANFHRLAAQEHTRAGTRADNSVITRDNQRSASARVRAESERNTRPSDVQFHKNGEEMDAKEKDELIKTLSETAAAELKKILGGEDLKKTLTEIVSAEMKKSDDRFAALQENVDTLGEIFAKTLGVEVEDEAEAAEPLSKTLGARLAKLLEEPADDKTPLKKVTKDQEVGAVLDEDLSKADGHSLMRASLREPIPMFRK